MKSIIFLSLALVACDHWNRSCEDLADWTIPISRGDSDEGADANAMRGPDGSLFVAFTDDDVTFGDMRVSGPHVAHVGVDGTILATAAVATTGMYPGVMRTNSDRLVVAWGLNPASVSAFDYDLHQLWSVPLGIGYQQPLALAPTGDVVTTSVMQGPTMQQTTLLYINRDGTTRWSLTDDDWNISYVRVLDNGDVLAFVYENVMLSRRTFAASDGAVLDNVFQPPNPFPESGLILPDGGSIVIDTEGPYTVRRVDKNGVRLWSHYYAASALYNPVLSTTGDILLQGAHEEIHGTEYIVLALDGTTGDERATRHSCGYVTVLAADADHYYGLGLTGSSSVGLARFSMTP